MPKIIRTDIPDLLPMFRKPGLHLSDIIQYLLISRGIYKESAYKNSTRLQLGLAFEWATKARYREDPRYNYVEMAFTKDRIHCNPDFVDLGVAVDEFKCTWLSSSKGWNDDGFDESFWKFIVQDMGYCYGLDYSVGRLHVCHVNGNYKWGTDGAEPTCPVYEEKWTRRQLLRNWEMLRSNANDAWKWKQGLLKIGED
jgi:hypothetical protein